MGYEIAEQLGWQMPDVILYPTGGGVGIIGIHKALRELRELGWITGDLPRLVAVQATGLRADRRRAFERGARGERRLSRRAHGRVRHHRAQGARRLPRAGRGLRRPAARRSRSPTRSSWRPRGRSPSLEGAFICPEGAACFAALGQLTRIGLASRPDDEVVVLNTGAGVKYPETVPLDVPLLAKDGRIPGRTR